MSGCRGDFYGFWCPNDTQTPAGWGLYKRLSFALIQNHAKNLKIIWNLGTWILIWEYSTRAILWIPTWQGLDGFQRSLRHCALDESIALASEGLASCVNHLFFSRTTFSSNILTCKNRNATDNNIFYQQPSGPSPNSPQTLVIPLYLKAPKSQVSIARQATSLGATSPVSMATVMQRQLGM